MLWLAAAAFTFVIFYPPWGQRARSEAWKSERTQQNTPDTRGVFWCLLKSPRTREYSGAVVNSTRILRYSKR